MAVQSNNNAPTTTNSVNKAAGTFVRARYRQRGYHVLTKNSRKWRLLIRGMTYKRPDRDKQTAVRRELSIIPQEDYQRSQHIDP